MTYDRLKAKIIPEGHCRFCGKDTVPLVKTKCCDQWICCDTSFASIEGGVARWTTRIMTAKDNR